VARNLRVQTAGLLDALALSSVLREADRQEIEASTTAPVESALADAVNRSYGACWSVYSGDDILLLMGAAPIDLLGGLGSPWLLGSQRSERFGKSLHKIAREKIAESRLALPRLVNFIDARNTRSIAWLARLGFTLHEPEPYGPHGLPFHRFEMRADHVLA
jgi:hypothetical protein